MALWRALKDAPTFPNRIYADAEKTTNSGIVALIS